MFAKICAVIGLLIVFAWFLGGGIGHFTTTDFFVSIVPPYVPYPLQMVYFTGVCEIFGALGIVAVRTRRWAGWGLFALTLAVTPANVHMWMHPELFPTISPTALSVRLVVQVILLAVIWWSTQSQVGSSLSVSSFRKKTQPQ